MALFRAATGSSAEPMTDRSWRRLGSADETEVAYLGRLNTSRLSPKSIWCRSDSTTARERLTGRGAQFKVSVLGE